MWQFLTGWAVTRQPDKEVQLRFNKGRGVWPGKKEFFCVLSSCLGSGDEVGVGAVHENSSFGSF